MKKIGILTQSLGRNYGGALQAFALQRTLETLGYRAQVLRREHHIGRLRRLAMWGYYFLRRNILQIKVDKKNVFKNIEHFCDTNISRTTPIYNSRYLRKISQRFDTIVVGSDQVWRVDYSPQMDDYFLAFAQGRSNLKRVAYAASFGVEQWQFTDDKTLIYGNLLKLFDGVSVREESAVELCARHFGVDSQLVLDPTLLLDPNDYAQLFSQEKQSQGNLNVYILDQSEMKTQAVEIVAQTTGLENQMHTTAHTRPAVSDWLRGFYDAKFVVTDSFHGCVFSILFNKPFIAIGNRERGLTRFTSLLKQFGLEERLVSDPSQITPQLIESQIDWGRINATREMLKTESIEFLKQSLQ